MNNKYSFSFKHDLENFENKLLMKGIFTDKYKLDDYYQIGEMIELNIMHLIYDYYCSIDEQLKEQFGKKINVPNIEKIHQFYLIIKNGIPMSYELSWGHYKELIKLHDLDLIRYYHDIAIDESLSVKELHKLLQQEVFNDME